MMSLAQIGSSESISSRILQLGLLLDKVYTPILCLFGALGNSLSLAVFCLDSKYRSLSSSYYLSALAVSDTGFLLNLFAVWLESIHGGGVITSDLMCPLVMYLGQVTCFISIYLMVAFSIERFVAVHYPFSRPRICTKSKAKKGIVGVATVALLLFSYAWFIAQVIEIEPATTSSSKISQAVGNGSDVAEDWVSDNFSIQVAESHFKGEQVANPVEIDGHPTAETSVFFITENDNEQTGQTEEGSLAAENDPSQSVINMRHKETGKLLNIDNDLSGSIKLTLVENADRVEHRRLYYFRRLSDEMTDITMKQHSNTNKNEEDPMFPGGIITYENQSNGITSRNQEDLLKLLASSTATPDQSTGKRDSRAGYSKRRLCSVPKHYYKISEVANYLDTAITLIIPFLLITYFNVRIAVSVWKLQDQRQHIVASPSMARSSTRVKSTVVLGNRRHGAHSHTTQVANSSLLHPDYNLNQRRDSSSSCEEDHLDCHCQQSQRELSVRFEDDTSPSGSRRYSATSSREGNMGLNGTDHCQMSVASPKPILRNGGVKREFSIFNRGSKADYQTRHTHNSSHSCSSEVRVTKLLLLVSTVFLVLNLPLHAIRCTQFIQSVTGTKEGKDILQALQPWANLLFNTNFAVNFFLYCASGRNFRKSLKHITSRVLGTSPQQQLSLSSAPSHHLYHSERGSGRRRKCGKNSTPKDGAPAPQTTRNDSKCSTSFARGPQASVSIELDEMVSL